MHYEFEDREEIMNYIKSVDLDKVIYDEIEFNVDEDVKKYLIQIKDDDLIYKLQDKIEATTLTKTTDKFICFIQCLNFLI
mgnify:CR=1 FL=1